MSFIHCKSRGVRASEPWSGSQGETQPWRVTVVGFFSFSFLFYTGVGPINNVVIVSGGQQRDAMVHIQASILKVTG